MTAPSGEVESQEGDEVRDILRGSEQISRVAGQSRGKLRI